MDNSQKKIKWYMLSFMCFSTLWGFGNVVNGYMYFNGLQVIFSWVWMFALYFVPYALMVGELGSAFKDLGGGVTSWVRETTGSKVAYYAGWTLLGMPCNLYRIKRFWWFESVELDGIPKCRNLRYIPYIVRTVSYFGSILVLLLGCKPWFEPIEKTCYFSRF
mgnify:CR=1 FL=1